MFIFNYEVQLVIECFALKDIFCRLIFVNMQAPKVFQCSFRSYRYTLRNFSSSASSGVNTSSSSVKVSSPDTSLPTSEDEAKQFRYLLRNSNFVNMGDPTNKIVRGKIFHTVADDLYVDFEWKFYCVCPRPEKNGELYVRGSEVLLKIKELELSSHFLGTLKALTLLEADASIISLISSPRKIS